jgi:hypothetical protein
MECKNYKKFSSEKVSANKAYIEKEDRESEKIAKEFKRKTKLKKRL